MTLDERLAGLFWGREGYLLMVAGDDQLAET